MKIILENRAIGLVAAVAAVTLFIACPPTEKEDTPTGKKPMKSTITPETGGWWPSRYGAGDGIGAAREITGAKVKEAAALIKTGKAYDLQLTLENGAPAFSPRYYQFQLMYNNIHETRKLGPNDFRWSDEIIAGNLGTFTQVDCLGHGTIGERMYNGREWGKIAKPDGLTELGCETIPPIFTRGLLVDVAAYKGKSVLPGAYEITVEDISGALKKQGNMQIKPGDAVILHTGWIQTHWRNAVDKKDPTYISQEPGIGRSAAKWLGDKRVTAVGADTWGIDNFSVPLLQQGAEMFPAHQELITKRGIVLLENVVTEQLAKEKAYQFALVATMLKAKGSGQTWGTFMAIR